MTLLRSTTSEQDITVAPVPPPPPPPKVETVATSGARVRQRASVHRRERWSSSRNHTMLENPVQRLWTTTAGREMGSAGLHSRALLPQRPPLCARHSCAHAARSNHSRNLWSGYCQGRSCQNLQVLPMRLKHGESVRFCVLKQLCVLRFCGMVPLVTKANVP